MCAGFEPGPQAGRVFQQSMLHINLLRLIPGEREIEPFEVALLEPGSELIFVQKIRGAFLIAKEEPILSLRAGALALFEESAERGNTGAGADHDHWRVSVRRQLETIRRLHEHPHVARLTHAVR